VSDSEYCTSSSQAAGESLLGTATEGIHSWIALEVHEPWAAKPIDSEVLRGDRRAAIESWLTRLPGSRLQLVRRARATDARRSLFIGSSSPDGAWLARLDGADLDALCTLDVPALFAERGGDAAVPLDRMILVCTHGKRDRCCAKFGVGLFHAASTASEAVWQTTHLGGHRFAATALVLPSGIAYGRLEIDDVEPWLAAEARGHIFDLGKVRGRTCYPGHVQAAEVLALEELGLRGSDVLTLLGETANADGTWQVRFRHASGEIAVEVESRSTGTACLGSCGDDAPKPIANLRRARRATGA